jgi:hypothetical protein
MKHRTKYQTLWLLIAVVGLVASAHADELKTIMTCKSTEEGPAFVKITKGGFQDTAHVTFNFSTGDVVCPVGVEERIINHESIRCYGLWSYDSDDLRGRLDTAIDLFVGDFLREDRWSAHFRTSTINGLKDISLTCKKGEQQ